MHVFTEDVCLATVEAEVKASKRFPHPTMKRVAIQGLN
jgi:hypothetical protein